MRIFLVSEQLLLQELTRATFQPGEVQPWTEGTFPFALLRLTLLHLPNIHNSFFFFPTQKQTNLFFYSSVGMSFL